MDCEEIADNISNNFTESDSPILIESFAPVQEPIESFEGHFGKLLLKLFLIVLKILLKNLRSNFVEERKKVV